MSSGPGARERTWFLNGGGATGGTWTSDVANELPIPTAQLRTQAVGPCPCTCASIGSGMRLGTDRDEDGMPNGSDFCPGDASVFEAPGLVTGVAVDAASSITWSALTPAD